MKECIVPIYINKIKVDKIHVTDKFRQSDINFFGAEYPFIHNRILDSRFVVNDGKLYHYRRKDMSEFEGVEIHLCSKCINQAATKGIFLKYQNNEEYFSVKYFDNETQKMERTNSVNEFYEKHSNCLIEQKEERLYSLKTEEEFNRLFLYGMMSREIQKTRILFDSEIINNEDFNLYYYVKDNIIVGYFVVDFVVESGDETLPVLLDMFVLDSYRKQGLANKFLDYFFEFVKEKYGSDYKVCISIPINFFLAKTILRKSKERGKNELYLVGGGTGKRKPTSLSEFEDLMQKFESLSKERNSKR